MSDDTPSASARDDRSALNTEGIVRQIVVKPSDHFPDIDTIEIPGLGFYASRESAQLALDKLDCGECPMTHLIEPGFQPRTCRICGTAETVDHSLTETEQRNGG